MALFVHKEAQLGELEGTGYLFQNKNTIPATMQGVFFGLDGEAEAIEAFVEEDPIPFRGVLYKKNRSGKVTHTNVELTVDVKQFREVSMGPRALIEVVEEEA
jgi:hypothetical protein